VANFTLLGKAKWRSVILMKASSPKRGELYWVDWNPARGSEQAGMRPALIVQNDIGNEYGRTVIVATLTTTTKNYEFFVPLESGEGGTKRNSAVNTAHLLTIEKNRLGRKLGRISENSMRRVERALLFSLGMGRLIDE